MTRRPADIANEFALKYYRQAIGLTVVDVQTSPPEFGLDPWVTLVCERSTPSGETERFMLEISADPEGNGPGFLFGLPNPTTD